MKTDPREHLEIERKYEVSLDALMPSVSGEALIAGASEVFDLRATYFDTADFMLARTHIAVRNRQGGDDAGWHIKLRTSAGVEETEWPESDSMPDALVVKLRELTGVDQIEVKPIGTIRTHRTSHMLTNLQGEPVMELVDDVVRAHDAVHDVFRAWREWEAELVSGAPVGVFDDVEPSLIAAGALPSLSESKISRTMGTALEIAKHKGASAEQLASLAITDVADRMAAETVTERADPRVTALRNLARALIQ